MFQMESPVHIVRLEMCGLFSDETLEGMIPSKLKNEFVQYWKRYKRLEKHEQYNNPGWSPNIRYFFFDGWGWNFQLLKQRTKKISSRKSQKINLKLIEQNTQFRVHLDNYESKTWQKHFSLSTLPELNKHCKDLKLFFTLRDLNVPAVLILMITDYVFENINIINEWHCPNCGITLNNDLFIIDQHVCKGKKYLNLHWDLIPINAKWKYSKIKYTILKVLKPFLS